MINKIIQFSIANKFSVGFFTLALILYGIYSVTQLPIDAVPDITDNQVQVITLAPTLGAQEVEQFITAPIELAFANIPEVEQRRSISRSGLSVITIVFHDRTDLYWARQQITERLKEAESHIPEGLAEPELAPITTGLGEIYHYVVYAKQGYENKYATTDLRTVQDWIIKPQLSGVPGVAEVSAWGGYVKTYEVAIDNDRLKSMNVSIPEVFEALEHNNENTGGSYIEQQDNLYFIRGIGQVKSLDDIGKTVIKNVNNVPVLIQAVAKVQYGAATRYGAVTRDGRGEVVGGVVLMLKGENFNEVSRNVKARMHQIQKSLPEGVVAEPYIDRSELVNRAMGTVERNLLEGALIVIFILVLFLGNLRAGFIVASVIPMAMLFAIVMMNLFGVSGNLMSLGAIDFGLIVDGAVIIVEAILHRVTNIKIETEKHPGLYTEKYSGKSSLSKEQMNHEVYHAASRMMNSAAFGQIIILIVYIPILTLIGIEGKMFRPMAMTVSFAIIGALILSLTYIPMMSALFLPKKPSHNKNISDRMMDTFSRWYQPIINFAINRKAIVIGIAVILFIGSVFMFTRMGSEFIPTLEEGDLTVEIFLPQGTSLTKTVETYSMAEKILKEKFPEIKHAVTRIGSGEIPTDPMPIEAGDIMLAMKPMNEWTSAHSREEMQEEIEEALSDIPGAFVEVTQPMQMRFNELMTGIKQDVAVKIFGDDLNTLEQKASEVAKVISSVEGVTEPGVERVSGLPQMVVEYDRNKLAQYGLSVRDVNKILSTAYAGTSAGVVYEGEKRFDLVVRLQPESRTNLDDIRNLFVPLPDAGQVELRQLADIQLKEAPAQISREDGKRRIYVGFNVRGRDMKSVVDEIQKKLDEKIKLPPGYYFTYGGTFQNLVEANKRLSIALPGALVLIFLLLFLTFGSAREALLIYTAIPMSAIGGVIALWLRDMPFSISAGVGFIALFGVAVLNGIVLISTFNQLEKEGIADIRERVLKGTRIRLRPVLMTASVASLGFLPMAISISAGAEVQRPLATVVIGGLISSTALTLIVLPALYILFSRRRKIKTTTTSATIILLLTSFATQSSAQTTQSPLVVSLDSAVNMAMRNNPALQSSQLQLTQQQKLQKTAFDFAKTGLFYENEDLRSDQPDNKGILKIGITQSFEFPTTYFAQGKVNKQNTGIVRTNLSLVQKDLLRDVRSAYFNLWLAVEKQKLFMQQDSIFTEFENAATLRFNTGETNKLEMLSAQAKHKEIQLALQSSSADVIIAQQELMKWMNVSEAVLPETTQVQKLKLEIGNSGSQISNFNFPISDHPYLQLPQQKISLAEYQKKVEVNKFLPDLNIRYFNQNWLGIEPGYYGYSLGISVPLFFWSQQGKIQAAKLRQQIAQKDFETATLQFNTAYIQTIQELNKQQQLLQYYETTGVQQADELLHSATLAFKNGEIGYIEYTSLLSQSIDIKNNYLTALNNYNQAVIKLNYFLNL
ncbi:MAG TPA: CusA/CzcA family heavy metal efflux RND transporter [Chitinophagales bacterium]|nr:CusA/CzcA family heavy metal efflux RND transporter [Chitinophagales bacterium]